MTMNRDLLEKARAVLAKLTPEQRRKVLRMIVQARMVRTDDRMGHLTAT